MATDEQFHREAPASGGRQRFEAGQQRADDHGWVSIAARSAALQQSLIDAAHRLAATEDDAARLYDEIASLGRTREATARRLAEHARASARRAREIADHFHAATDPD
ncbi:hypothetical protein [Nocardia sp. NPDC050175]|uniref:hypothetical protein n=1 Tax=Nocardia sp. NPDC050175 TaxID=3364317 RepID=UPI0037957DA1